MLQNRSDSPQIKRNVISSIDNLVYELSHDFPNDLRLRMLGSKKKLGNSRNLGGDITQCTVFPFEIQLWQ